MVEGKVSLFESSVFLYFAAEAYEYEGIWCYLSPQLLPQLSTDIIRHSHVGWRFKLKRPCLRIRTNVTVNNSTRCFVTFDGSRRLLSANMLPLLRVILYCVSLLVVITNPTQSVYVARPVRL
jgi:hypothetical protein